MLPDLTVQRNYKLTSIFLVAAILWPIISTLDVSIQRLEREGEGNALQSCLWQKMGTERPAHLFWLGYESA